MERRPDPVDLVDPFIGTGGGGFSQGQAFVGATVPFGMVKPGPDTTGFLPSSVSGFAHTSGYWYIDDVIEGFSNTHLHGTGIEDYGNVLLMPAFGMDADKTEAAGYRQRFSHTSESASPGYYGVTLLDTGIEAELTASSHAAFHRYTYPRGRELPAVVIVDVGHGIGRGYSPDADVLYDPEAGELSGWMTNAGRFTGVSNAFRVYFSIVFSPVPTAWGTWNDGVLAPGGTAVSGQSVGAWVQGLGTSIEARVGISYIDVEQARTNRGLVGADFDTVHALARERWSEQLALIRVEGGSEVRRRIFTTALYHSLLMPTLYTEWQSLPSQDLFSTARYVDLGGEIQVPDSFTYFTDFSLWDTYRTVHPLISLIAPDRARDFALSLLAMADVLGYVPRWPLAQQETGTMLGAPGTIVLVDTVARARGMRGFEERVWEVVRDDADLVAGHTIRTGVADCYPSGFCPADRVGRSVSESLEYAWADFAAAQMAARRGLNAKAEQYAARATGWRRHWDADTWFLRARNADGTWAESSFDPVEATEHYAEGNAWQYLWAVPFAVPTLIELFGGRAQMLYWLDSFFRASRDSPTPQLTDEFTLPDPYYWHGNEPDIHAPYLYALAGEPGRGAQWIDWVRRTKYDDTPAGINGNDDCGTLSAWLVWSALGLYPLAGSDIYVIGTPWFERATVNVGYKAPLEIVAHGVSETAIYPQAVTLDGEPLSSPILRHPQIARGGRLVFEMGEAPSNWGRGAVPDLMPAVP